MSSKTYSREELRRIADVTDPFKAHANSMSQFLNRFPVFCRDDDVQTTSAVPVKITIPSSSEKSTRDTLIMSMEPNSMADNVSTSCTTELS